ncbi:activating molecule in BECN1-regulated autophagy protein 1 [Trichonephila inaurata madagascariensis]|uniref:Activating molecule in BECN1-regulated autophagy protein 1 n=1 Tax=Trichonephila inaurata madagascariensis TaxID=2747483 RepID=A0A8X6WTG2_9ARAC|nr:activating molecule in BECN1-regulated autophagy protein 1 [Trichonephila inaurata madagascariensis]
MEIAKDNEKNGISRNRIVKEHENIKNEKFPARKRRDTNILDVLSSRAQGSFKHERSPRLLLSYLQEAKVVSSEYKEMVCELPINVISTFLMSYSSDGKIVATNHGDFSIWLTNVSTGKCIGRCAGHSSIPWCLKFHPSSNSIFASGCMRGELRIWNINGETLNWHSNKAITSLDFHPSGDILAIASGDAVYFWRWKETLAPTGICRTYSAIEIPKFVKFYHSGNSFVTGIFNKPNTTCPYQENKKEVLSDSSDAQIPSSSSVTENNAQEEDLSDSDDDAEILPTYTRSLTDEKRSHGCSKEEDLSDSDDDAEILPTNTRSLTDEKRSHGCSKENILSDASDVEIIYTNVNPLDGGNCSYSSTEKPKASQNFQNVNTAGKTSASQGQVNNVRTFVWRLQTFSEGVYMQKDMAACGQIVAHKDCMLTVMSGVKDAVLTP